MDRYGEAGEIGELIAFLVSPGARWLLVPLSEWMVGK
jgi:hypothetical protein